MVVFATVSLKYIPAKNLRSQFLAPNLTIDELDELINKFIKSVKNNTWNEDGWPKSTYVVSKVGVNMYTRILARDEKRNILINCCDPGDCKTDMSNHTGRKTAEQGSFSSVHLALLPHGSTETGGFFSSSANSVSVVG